MRAGWFLLGAAIGLVGCAKQVCVKDGATQQVFLSERYQCERDMRQSGYYGGGLAGELEMGRFFDRCMEAHGYRLVAAESATKAAQHREQQDHCRVVAHNTILDGNGRLVGTFQSSEPIPSSCTTLDRS